MNVYVTKINKTGNKIITGKLLQDGLGFVSVIVTAPDGTQSIKRFDKSKYIVKVG